ncbi:MAG TPA: hypothetical protein VKA07_06870 [Candidatus Sulfotelmatobacter sp.]|nr:hypothetical protein [Candidatus Sulfotelmatobacter sp.]
MHVCAKRFVMATILLASPLWSQEVHHTDNPNLLARFSYESSATQQENADRRVCMAVSRGGDYRILRLRDDGQTVLREGKMLDEQFKQLQDLLSASEFRALSGSHGGVIRNEAETFSAEISRGPDKAQRVQLLNADGGNPFPGSVKKLVDWLENFQIKNGNSLDDAESADVCPSVGLRLLQPSVATNQQ